MPSLSPESRRALADIVRDVVAPSAERIDRDTEFPRQAVSALAEAGLLGAVSSAEAGGLALGHRGAAEIVRALAAECGSTAMVATMHYCGSVVLEAHAPLDVRREAAAGRHLSTLAFSEAGSRSHFWAPVSSATPTSSGVRLDARKSWITSASHATAYVWSSQPAASEGLSTLWLVPATTRGLSVAGRFDGLGLRGNDSAPVTADGVELPESARLGEDGAGFGIMIGTVLPLFNDSPQATLIPLRLVREAGLEPGRDLEIVRFEIGAGLHGDHVGGERDAARALVQGQADAACMLDANHLAFSREGTLPPGGTRILAQTAPYDHCNFTAIRGQEGPHAARFVEALLSMSYEDPEVRLLLDLEGLRAWMPGRTSGYEQLDRALGDDGALERFLAAASACA